MSLIVPTGTESLYQNAAIWEDFNWPTSCVLATGTDVISSCLPVTWIDGNTYSSTNNTATHLLVGAAQGGCDSLVTLNLTVWNCTQLNATSCGASNISMNQNLRAIGVSGAVGYRFKISGPNNGGAGWNNNSFVYVVPNGLRNFKFSMIPGAIFGESYSVEAAYTNNQSQWSPYGNACTVSLNATITTSAVRSTICGTTVAENDFVRAINVDGVLAYRFRITGANSSNWNDNQFIFIPDNGDRKFRFIQIPGAIPGTTYMVDVAVQSADGTWGAYGSACPITLAGLNEFVLNNDEHVVGNKTLEVIKFSTTTSQNPFSTDFGIQVLNANDTESIQVVIYDMSGKLIESNILSPLDIENARFGSKLVAGVYLIEVRQGVEHTLFKQIKN